MKKFIIAILFLFCLGTSVKADSIGNRRNFYVDSGYDETNRRSLSAVLVASSPKANVYVDEAWWSFTSQESAQKAINGLVSEFDNKIYPTLVSNYGQEWTPGIDNDAKITILMHSMRSGANGYFRTNDEYPKIQLTDSNEREMIYINSKYISDDNLKSFVAHEFTHLITFNQKTKKYNVIEETWLDEARAEYSSTLVGYNNDYAESYLEKRVQSFLEKPTGSLIDWQNTPYDYGRVNLFVHYLVDHYGINVLIDSLHCQNVGIESINYALEKNNIKKKFPQIFNSWIVAVLINDCSYGKEYCYLTPSLKNFYLVPQISFLPLTGNTKLTMSDNAKIWSANWYKIIGGGGGELKFHFEGDPRVSYKMNYILKDQTGKFAIKTLLLNELDKGDLSLQNFGRDVLSLFIIPYLEGEDGELSDSYFHSFFWSASIIRQEENIGEINRLLSIIDNLKKQIAVIEAQKQSGQSGVLAINCQKINSNLHIGMADNNEVRCLQKFLKGQGGSIYPEGLITGNFGNLTRQAVIRFQEKYGQEILTPVGLRAGTGYVGSLTRQKINSMLNGI